MITSFQESDGNLSLVIVINNDNKLMNCKLKGLAKVNLNRNGEILTLIKKITIHFTPINLD